MFRDRPGQTNPAVCSLNDSHGEDRHVLKQSSITHFDRTWKRFEFCGTPIYFNTDEPNWFVPDPKADRILQSMSGGTCRVRLWKACI